MEMDVEKNVSNALIQTDLVTSPILQQCLYVIRNATEFQNLTCRVTKTLHNSEAMVVYREGALGIFGPPVDPITLTLDPKGRCLLKVLFRPVQRVHIVSPESGHLQIESLLTVLRLISGKGYLFCPGLPERFLAGKACGKFVVLHAIPFKRYQSPQCPVYYQVPVFQQNSKKSSPCAICPRCMQAAKLIQALPTFASNAAGTHAQIPRQFPVIIQLKPESNTIQGISTKKMSVQTSDNTAVSTVSPTSNSRQQSPAGFHSRTITSVSNEAQKLESTINSSQLGSGIDVNGNSQTTVPFKGDIFSDQSTGQRDNKETITDAKIQVLKTLLSSLLQDHCKKESVDSIHLDKETSGLMAASRDSDKTLNYQLQKGKLQKKNVCRYCKKQYSTPANLMNHLQRHEALSRSWQKRFKERKLRRKPNLFSLMHIGYQGTRQPAPLHRKKLTDLSETSIRILLKCLDDVITPQNGAKSFKQQEFNVMKDKIVQNENVEKQNNHERSQFVPWERIEIEDFGKRSAIKRTSRGLSPMQTLLEAAAIAEVGHRDTNNPIISSPSAFNPEIYQDTSVKSTISHLTVPTEQSEAIFPQKKRRKSSRLAYKRAKKHKQITKDDENCTQAVEVDNAVTSHEQSMLTNLNLLSTVSLETAMRQAPLTSQNQTSFSNSIPLTVLSPESKKDIFPTAASTVVSLPKLNSSHSVHPTSKTVSISQQMLNYTSGGNIVISRTQDVCRPVMCANLQISSDHPPLPPLLFAGDVEGKSLLYPHLQKQQGQDQTVTTLSPSTVRSLVTMDNKQPSPSVSLASDGPVKNHSTNSDCGAMDLSKPKLSQVKTSSPVSTEKGVDWSSLSCLPHNIVQLVAGNENPSEVLQCFMLMAKTAGVGVSDIKETKPVMSSIISDKQTDSDLQARMFASASNYRIDKGLKKSQQVQSVIASSSRITQSGKGTKPGGVVAVQAEEIQCGYKWSGSGGSVKERTQMVRELVPPDVMASFLTKSVSSSPSHQSNVSLIKSSQPQQSNVQLIQTSTSEWPTQIKSQDLSAPELALNLITNKSTGTPFLHKGIPGKVQKYAVISSSPPVPNLSTTSPSVIKGSILRTSLTNTETINKLLGHTPDADSPQRLHSKTVSISITSSPSPSSLTITSPTSCSISSPSLAAMLRQPTATLHEVNHSNILNTSVVSLASPVSVTQRNSIIDSFSLLSLPRGVQIKTEPAEPCSPNQDMVMMALPIKTEIQDADVEKVQVEASWDAADSSPTNLVVDICPDATRVRNIGKKLKSRSAPVSRAQDITNKKNSVRCEH